MAAKLLHSLADENPDLQKQIGCMTGIFQVFDRHHVLTGRRMSHKGLPPSNSNYGIVGHERHSNNIHYHQPSMEMGFSKSVTEKQRFSTESSRASFSSACSSSASSVDFEKASHQEVSSTLRDMPANHSQATTSPRLGRLSLDLREVVKDAMYRETARALSGRQETATKHRDSPRPPRVDFKEQQTDSVDLKDSLRVLAKLKEAPWYYNDARDAPRFSFESRDSLKSTAKLKELPRLSLDGRESLTVQSSRSDSKLARGSRVSTENDVFSHGATQKRPTSVVAKLMGLDALPDSAHSKNTESLRISDAGHRTTRALSSPSGSLVKEPSSPKWKNPDLIMKPISTSRFPVEAAPWNKGSPRASSSLRAATKSSSIGQNSFPSVYSEIEKRLDDLEFKQSGKDLRALMHILEKMQVKGLLQTRREEQTSLGQRNPMNALGNGSTVRSSSSSLNRTYESPIVIMKPANRMSEKPSPHNGRTAKDNSHSPKYNTKTAHSSSISTSSSSRSQQKLQSNNTNSAKSSNSVSPRLQKKQEMEKRARPPTAPSSSSPIKPRRQSSSTNGGHRQAVDSGTSPGGRSRKKYVGASQCDDQLSDISTDSKSLSCQGDDNTSVASDGNFEKRTLRLDDDVAYAELSAVAPEHPSPVSVLDASAYKDDEPSPVKQIATPLKDLWKPADNFPNKAPETKIAKKLENIENLVQKLRRLNSSHDEARTDYIASLCENSNPDHRYISEILLASGLLLRDLSSGMAAFQLHPSGHPINPELFFVLEQTKASSSEKGNLVKSSNPDKFRRKLIFDAVNEVLAGKLGLVNILSREPWLGPEKLAKKTLNAQRLLKELCHEIEQFQARKRVVEQGFEAEADYLKGILCEDVMHRSENWTEFFGEVSGVVLDIERSIFKDLVDEIVRGEAANWRFKSARRRQLFSK